MSGLDFMGPPVPPPASSVAPYGAPKVSGLEQEREASGQDLQALRGGSRSESGRSYEAEGAPTSPSPPGRTCAMPCAPRDAFPKWADLTAYNRGQVLYRVAEMMEGAAPSSPS